MESGTPISTAKNSIPSSKPFNIRLAARSDSRNQDIDWTFISQREGGQQLVGYVPHTDGSQSGVTIATGIDLGARSESDIERLDIPTDLKKKLKPYAGKKGKTATDYLKKNPLIIATGDAYNLDKAVKKSMVDILISKYDAAVEATNTIDCGTRIRFVHLPRSVQTAIASIAFQYGSLESKTPKFWQQITEQRWQVAIDNLRNFGDAYPTRRKLEAGLIEGGINSPARQQFLP